MNHVKHRIVFRLLVAVIFMMICTVGSARPEKHHLEPKFIDSISTQVKTLNQLSEKLIDYNPDSAWLVAVTAIQLSKSCNLEIELAQAYKNSGYALMHLGKYRQALADYQEALILYNKLELKPELTKLHFRTGQAYSFLSGKDSALAYFDSSMRIAEMELAIEDVASAHYGIGYVFYDEGTYDSALVHFIEGLKVADNKPECDDIVAKLNNGAGNVCYDWGKHDEAVIYFEKALDMNRKIGNRSGIAYSINNIGNTYFDWGKFPESLENYQTALGIFIETGNINGIAMANHNTGLAFSKLNNYDSAYRYFNKTFEIHQNTDNLSGMAAILNEMGQSALEQGDYKRAIEDLKKSQVYAEKTNFRTVIYDNYHLLSRAFQNMGDFSQALENYKLYIKVRDELFNEKSQQQFADLQTKYETEKKDHKIMVLEQQNILKETKARQNRIIFWGSGLLMFLAILMLIVLLRQGQLKNSHKTILLEQKLLRSQMNPHFIFNSLSSIQNSIINEETEKAMRYLTRFAKLMRQILESSNVESVSLSDEITTIDNYLALQKIRFPEKFNYKIDVDPTIDTESFHIPPMLTQPFIENAIEHGIKYKGTVGRIEIRINRQNELILIEIEDDGIGREKSKELRQKYDKDHKSLATAITQERIRLLNKKQRKNIMLDIIDLKDELGEPSGTKVVFRVPV